MAKIDLKTTSGKVILGVIIWLAVMVLLGAIYLFRIWQKNQLTNQAQQQFQTQRAWEEQSLQLLDDLETTQQLGQELVLPQVDEQLRPY